MVCRRANNEWDSWDIWNLQANGHTSRIGPIRPDGSCAFQIRACSRRHAHTPTRRYAHLPVLGLVDIVIVLRRLWLLI